MKFNELMDHEQEEIRKGVRQFDLNNSGYVPTKQLGNVLRWLKLIPTNAEVEQLTAQLDPDNTGKIKHSTMYSTIAALWPSQPTELESKAWQAFLAFDKCDTGKLTANELKRILTGVGLEPLTEQEVKKIIKEHSDPKDGMIEYGVLIRTWLK